MQIKRHLTLNLTLIALAAVIWQAEGNAQTTQTKEVRPRSKGVGNRSAKRWVGVRNRRHLRKHLSRLRERARAYEPVIAAAARKHRVDPRVLWTIAYLETRFRPELVSPARARGLMQFMPGTARRFNLTNPHDGSAAIDAAARYVKELADQFGGRLDLVLASYNAGESAVDCYRTGRTLRTSAGKVINPRGTKTSGVPPYAETVSYVKRGLLVFSRVTSAGVFNPELIAGTRPLQSPAIAISVSDQRMIDRELRELGGLPTTMLFSGTKEMVIGQSGSNQRVALANRADAKAGRDGGFETVFFDVHSGARYLVTKGEIIRPLGAVGSEENEMNGSVEKSFYVGGGGR